MTYQNNNLAPKALRDNGQLRANEEFVQIYWKYQLFAYVEFLPQIFVAAIVI